MTCSLTAIQCSFESTDFRVTFDMTHLTHPGLIFDSAVLLITGDIWIIGAQMPSPSHFSLHDPL